MSQPNLGVLFLLCLLFDSLQKSVGEPFCLCYISFMLWKPFFGPYHMRHMTLSYERHICVTFPLHVPKKFLILQESALLKINFDWACESEIRQIYSVTKQSIFIEMKFLVDSEYPRICVDVGWQVFVSKQFVIGQSETNIHFKNVKTNHESFRDGDPLPHIHTNSGILRIHEKIHFYNKGQGFRYE